MVSPSPVDRRGLDLVNGRIRRRRCQMMQAELSPGPLRLLDLIPESSKAGSSAIHHALTPRLTSPSMTSLEPANGHAGQPPFTTCSLVPAEVAPASGSSSTPLPSDRADQ